MTPSREVFWNINYHWMMYVLLLPTLAIFGYGIYQRYLQWSRLGQKINRLDNFKGRLFRTLSNVFGHKKLLRDVQAGLMHGAIFWGMVILFIGTALVAIDIDLRIPVNRGWVYLILKLAMNIAGVFVLIGVVVAAIRRYILEVPRLQPNREGVPKDPSDALGLTFLGLLVIQGFALQAIRLAVSPDPWVLWSPVGYFLSWGLRGISDSVLVSSYQAIWWFHMLTTFVFIAWLPYGKMIHILTTTASVYTANLELPGVGTVKPMDFEASERLGVSSITDFNWRDLLELDACTACGRCQDVCPAHASGQPLSPRNMILNLRDHMHTTGQKLIKGTSNIDEVPGLAGNTVNEEAIWACTTCRSCMEECPADIEHVSKITSMRRYLAMEQSQVPETVQDALKSLEDRVHPYKGSTVSRLDWCEGLDVPLVTDADEVDVLFWVGCTTAFDARNQKVARAFAGLMKEAGVKFAILGNEETCCGDPARRVGNEFGYDMIVRANIETISQYNPQCIVTTCPHCFNALSNEYQQFGANFKVKHHTQLLKELVAEGKLKVSPQQTQTVTYHDPCYLGRYNSEYEAARDLLAESGSKLLEMKRSRSKSFCCGAGGGHAWMEEHGEGPRINQLRSKQAIETGAKTVVVSCPFCLQMMEDGLKTVAGENGPGVKDIAELLIENFDLKN